MVHILSFRTVTMKLFSLFISQLQIFPLSFHFVIAKAKVCLSILKKTFFLVVQNSSVLLDWLTLFSIQNGYFFLLKGWVTYAAKHRNTDLWVRIIWISREWSGKEKLRAESGTTGRCALKYRFEFFTILVLQENVYFPPIYSPLRAFPSYLLSRVLYHLAVTLITVKEMVLWKKIDQLKFFNAYVLMHTCMVGRLCLWLQEYSEFDFEGKHCTFCVQVKWVLVSKCAFSTIFFIFYLVCCIINVKYILMEKKHKNTIKQKNIENTWLFRPPHPHTETSLFLFFLTFLKEYFKCV